MSIWYSERAITYFLMTSSMTYCHWNIKLLHEWKKCYSTHFVYMLAWMKTGLSLPSESLLMWSSVDGRLCLSSPRSEWEILLLWGDSLYSCTHEKDKETDELRHAVMSHKHSHSSTKGRAGVKGDPSVQGACSRHACVTRVLFKVKKRHAHRISCCLNAEL